MRRRANREKTRRRSSSSIVTDDATILPLLRSGNVKKQVQALQYILKMLLSTSSNSLAPAVKPQQASNRVALSNTTHISENVRLAIAEHGLSSESDLVRSISFKIVGFIYRYEADIFAWQDVKTALSNEISNAESVEALRAALNILTDALPLEEQVQFYLSKDFPSMLKSILTSERVELRIEGTRVLPRLMIFIFILIDHNQHDALFDVEGYIQTDSLSDLRRLRDDFTDLFLDTFGHIANGVVGKAASADANKLLDDDYGFSMVCCDSLMYLLSIFNANFDCVNQWTDTLLGISSPQSSGSLCMGSNVLSSNHSKIISLDATRATSLLPCLIKCITTIFVDPFYLLGRWQSYTSVLNPYTNLLNQSIMFILNDLSYSPEKREQVFPVVWLQTMTQSSSFAFAASAPGNASTWLEEIRMSKAGSDASHHGCINFVEFVNYWIEHCMLYCIQEISDDSHGLWITIKDMISIIEHRRMEACKMKVSI
jgi:hypothetical protein